MIINHDFGADISKTPLHRSGARPCEQSLGLVLYVGLAQDHTDNRNKSLCMTASDFLSMDRPTFQNLAPRLVLSPLVSGDMDVLDFAGKLQSLGFKGRFRAVIRKLPDAMMVMREVKAVAPDVNFAVTEIMSA